MADALDTITKLIQSPPGQLAAGGVLAGIVWKFFERVEGILTERTKLEIAVWLLDRPKLSRTFQSWPDTAAKVFDRVFGNKHLSLRCFGRSCIASLTGSIVVLLIWLIRGAEWIIAVNFTPWLQPTRSVKFGVGQNFVVPAIELTLILNLLPDYLSLLGTRWILGRLKYTKPAISTAFWLGMNFYVVAVLARLTSMIGLDAGSDYIIGQVHPISRTAPMDLGRYTIMALIHPLPAGHSTFSWVLWYYPTFVTSIWLWLYAIAGFLLKAARRFDIGFAWFNQHADIEKKPLSAIGLVAGALVALTYWAAAIVSRVI